MPIIFPSSPSVNQLFTVGDITRKWDGVTWSIVSTTIQGVTGSIGIQGVQGTTGLQGSSGQATVYRWTKTAVGAETSLSGNDNNSIALTYTVNQELLHINGVLQVRGTDYIATTGTTITGLTALTNGDIIDIWSPNSFNVANTYTTTETNALLAQLPTDAKVYFMKG